MAEIDKSKEYSHAHRIVSAAWDFGFVTGCLSNHNLLTLDATRNVLKTLPATGLYATESSRHSAEVMLKSFMAATDSDVHGDGDVVVIHRSAVRIMVREALRKLLNMGSASFRD